jgi:hypothetical protein
MIELAEQQKELLSKYGMVEEVLQNARQSIDQLDQVVERGAQGRRIHIGASACLEVAANQVVRLVRILDGFNRFRLGGDPNLPAGWIAATNIVGPPATGGQSVGRSGQLIWCHTRERPGQAGRMMRKENLLVRPRP